MRTIKGPNAVLPVLLILSGLACGNQEVQNPRKHVTNKTGETRSQTTNPKLMQLGAGDHSSIAESFVFVARNLETYELMRAVMTNLPDQSEEFFKSHAIVVVFLGQRPSGGFAIEVAYEAGALEITERRPPKGAMVKTVLTAPYKAIAIQLRENEPLALSLGETWKKQLRSYRITSGELMVSGGISGKQRRFPLQGTIEIMCGKELCTFIFDVRSSPDNASRLSDVASGKMDSKGEILLFPIDSFSLSGAILSPFRAKAKFTDGQQRLAMSLETIANPTVSDNFSGAGSIIAVATSLPNQER